MSDPSSREELNFLISSLDESIAVLEAKLKRAHAEHRDVSAIRRELEEVRRRRDELLDDLSSLPPTGVV